MNFERRFYPLRPGGAGGAQASFQLQGAIHLNKKLATHSILTRTKQVLPRIWRRSAVMIWTQPNYGVGPNDVVYRSPTAAITRCYEWQVASSSIAFTPSARSGEYGGSKVHSKHVQFQPKGASNVYRYTQNRKNAVISPLLRSDVRKTGKIRRTESENSPGRP